MTNYYSWLLRLLTLAIGLSLGTRLTASAQPCVAPTSIYFSTITATSITLTCDISPATAYTVLCVPLGASTSSGISVTGPSPLTINGLTANTTYQVYVRSICGSATSNQIGPLTLVTTMNCGPVTTYPYSENFDGTTAPVAPCDYTVLDANGDGLNWNNYSYTPTNYAASPPNCMRCGYSPTRTIDDWFFTRGLQMQAGVTYQLQFKYQVYYAVTPEALEVKIGPAATAAGQTQVLFLNTNLTNTSYLTTVAGSGAGQVQSFTPTTSGVYYLGFHSTSIVNRWYIYIDDLLVTASTATATRSSVMPGFRVEASPMPFGAQLTLQLTTLQAGALHLTLHDAVGRVVRQSTTTVPAGTSSLAVPGVSTLSAGLYFLTVQQGSSIQVIRVVHE